VRFEVADAVAAPVRLGPGDLAVGLHACGALGDALIAHARDAGSGVLLVSCCPQKIPGEVRRPLSALGRELGLSIAREHLGLANLATLAQGGKDSAGVDDRRRARHALRLLLSDAGLAVAHGEEMQGVHRRQLRRAFLEIARRVFAHRGLTAPTDAAIEDALLRAERERALARRFALPRIMLARALEVALVLDRARALEEHGRAPRVVTAFDRAASPRNIAIVRA
jgi:hypothetical protein